MSKATLDGKAIALEDAYKQAAQNSAAARPFRSSRDSAPTSPARAPRSSSPSGCAAPSIISPRAIRWPISTSSAPSACSRRRPMRRACAPTCVVLIGPGLTRHGPACWSASRSTRPPRHGAQAGQPRKVIWVGPEGGRSQRPSRARRSFRRRCAGTSRRAGGVARARRRTAGGARRRRNSN